MRTTDRTVSSYCRGWVDAAGKESGQGLGQGWTDATGRWEEVQAREQVLEQVLQADGMVAQVGVRAEVDKYVAKATCELLPASPLIL